jgi:hypothetical protein
VSLILSCLEWSTSVFPLFIKLLSDGIHYCVTLHILVIESKISSVERLHRTSILLIFFKVFNVIFKKFVNVRVWSTVILCLRSWDFIVLITLITYFQLVFWWISNQDIIETLERLNPMLTFVLNFLIFDQILRRTKEFTVNSIFKLILMIVFNIMLLLVFYTFRNLHLDVVNIFLFRLGFSDLVII